MKHVAFLPSLLILALLGCLILQSAAPASAQSGGTYDLSWSTIDGGGAISSGGSYQLLGTAGQPDASEPLSGGGYALQGGFLNGSSIPTAVALAAFSAAPQGDAILLAWETATELNNLGFNVYRGESAGGDRQRLNTSLIPSQHPGSSVGASYGFVDRSVEQGQAYYYWLEAVDARGGTQLYGPVSASLDPLRRLLPARPRLAPHGPLGYRKP